MKSRWNSKRNVKRSFSWNGIIVNTACACVKEFTYCMCHAQRNLPNVNCIDSMCLCTRCVPCAKVCHVPMNLPKVVHTVCAICQGIYPTLYIIQGPRIIKTLVKFQCSASCISIVTTWKLQCASNFVNQDHPKYISSLLEGCMCYYEMHIVASTWLLAT